MHRYKRSDRVSQLLLREISVIIDTELRDDRIAMVTITGVDISRDLMHARVYFTVLGTEEEIKLSTSTLNGASNFIRARLGERVILRHLPTLFFQYDSSTEYGMHIEKLFQDINNKNDEQVSEQND